MPMTTMHDLPSDLSKPAQRALAREGNTHLEQLAELSEAELSELHGVGPRAVGQLRDALAENGLSFANR
jgi:hypothetical protein